MFGRLLDKVESGVRPIVNRFKRKPRWFILGEDYIMLRLKNHRMVVAKRILSTDGDFVLYEDLYGNIKTLRKDMLEMPLET